MKKVIWKFNLGIHSSKQQLLLPKGSTILSVGPQGMGICVWVMVKVEEKETVRRNFEILGTGHEFDEGSLREFLGTCFMYPFVWHIFEIL